MSDNLESAAVSHDTVEDLGDDVETQNEAMTAAPQASVADEEDVGQALSTAPEQVDDPVSDAINETMVHAAIDNDAEPEVVAETVAEAVIVSDKDAEAEEAVEVSSEIDDALPVTPELANAVADQVSAEVPAADEVAVEEAAETVAAEVTGTEEPVDEESASPAEPEALAAAAEEATSQNEPSDDEGEDAQTRVVRRLAVGQEIEGVVKRTTEFGAFVDIGVGRDGLIHISELDVRRVGKVTDVVKEGQPITAWIKKLDRERNRISLTLIPPGTITIRDLKKGDVVPGKVTRLVPYGAFIDIGVGRDALLHVREMAEGYVAKPDDVVSEGEELEARIIEISRRRGRIDLSLKGLRPEPEVEEPEVPEEEVEEEVEDPFAEVEVLSPMELAFRKAMGEESDVQGTTKKRSKRARRQEVRAIQDEIISRTLDSGVN